MKKFRYIFLITFYAISFSLIGQTNFDWILHLANTTGATAPSAISIDHDFVYSTGSFSGTLSYKNQTISSSGNGNYAFLTKQDKIKKLLWFKSLGSINGNTQGTSVCADKLGNTYIAGTFSQETNIDGHPLTTTTNKASFIAKYNSEGLLIWVKMFESSNEMNITSVYATLQGDIYFGGYSKGSVDLGALHYTSTESKAFIVKTNNNGDILWASNSGDNNVATSEVKKLVADEYGNVYIVGVFNGTITLGDKTLISNSTNSFITKIKNTGSFDWTIQVGGSLNDALTDIDVKNGYIGVIGNANSNDITIKEKTDIPLNATGNNKILALAFNSDGQYLWNTVYGGGIFKSYGYAVAIDSQGNYYLGGSCNGTVDFNAKDPNNPVKPASKGGADMFVVKLSNLGNLLFANRFGGEITEQINDMCISDDDISLFSASEFKRRISGSTSYLTTNVVMQGEEYILTAIGAGSNTGLCMYTMPQITTRSVSAALDQEVNDCISQIGGVKASFSLIDGSLPKGVTLTSKGLFEGKPSEAGTYHFKVSLTLSDNGFDKIHQDITMYVSGSSSIKETNDPYLKEKINLFPNPNNGTFTLSLPSELQNKDYSYEIYDMLGHIVLKRTSYHLNEKITFSECNKGYYMIKVYNDNGVLAHPFLVK